VTIVRGHIKPVTKMNLAIEEDFVKSAKHNFLVESTVNIVTEICTVATTGQKTKEVQKK